VAFFSSALLIACAPPSPIPLSAIHQISEDSAGGDRYHSPNKLTTPHHTTPNNERKYYPQLDNCQTPPFIIINHPIHRECKNHCINYCDSIDRSFILIPINHTTVPVRGILHTPQIQRRQCGILLECFGDRLCSFITNIIVCNSSDQ